MTRTFTKINSNTTIDELKLIEVSSASLGSAVTAVSDDFFSPVTDLLKPEPPASKKGQFGPNGALYDGWESRRHNQAFDWAIIKLGAQSASLRVFDIDTTHFNGNEGPAASVYGIFAPDSDPANPHDSRWEEILPVVPLGPTQQHLFQLNEATSPYTHLQLRMIPDGGIARFRAYGTPTAVWPADVTAQLDLASVFNGGRVVFTSDQHFGQGGNIILPGRGKDMGDGWETKRSRTPGHKDWVVIELGAPGYLNHCEIDTCHFKGNFPAGVTLEGCYSEGELSTAHDESTSSLWTPLLPAPLKVGPHAQHYVQLTQPDMLISHVRVTIFPDGGLKRVRLVGSREKSKAADVATATVAAETPTTHTVLTSETPATSTTLTTPLQALPLTATAFADYGDVVQSYQDKSATPPSITTKRVNGGTATKLCNLSALDNSYPAESPPQLNFCVYKCDPVAAPTVKMLERHAYTSQSFIPMGNGGSKYVVVVALNGANNLPDMSTLRAFTASAGQGITYKKGVWHHPMIALERVTDFACLVFESGEGVDCEEVAVDKEYRIVL